MMIIITIIHCLTISSYIDIIMSDVIKRMRDFIIDGSIDNQFNNELSYKFYNNL